VSLEIVSGELLYMSCTNLAGGEPQPDAKAMTEIPKRVQRKGSQVSLRSYASAMSSITYLKAPTWLSILFLKGVAAWFEHFK